MRRSTRRRLCVLLIVSLLTLLANYWYKLATDAPVGLQSSGRNYLLIKPPAKVKLLVPDSIASLSSNRSFPLGKMIPGDGERDDSDGEEVHHVIFVKVHKAASSTVMSVFLRFAKSRQLNVMLPKNFNILSEITPNLKPLLQHPKSPPFHFDILCNHILFNYTFLQAYFPSDTKYVTILREPWFVVQSAFHYYKEVWPVGYLKKIANFSVYASDPARYETRYPRNSFTMNRMSTDLGFPPRQMFNKSYTSTFLRQLDSIFELVLIAERFEESMVLMKRKFRWKTGDILFVKINQHKHKTTDSSRGSDRNLRASIEAFNHHDVALYRHFLAVFQQKVEAEGSGFAQEVETFSTIIKNVEKYCADARRGYSRNLTIKATKWNDRIDLSGQDCELITMAEMPLVSLLRKEQIERLAPMLNSTLDKNPHHIPRKDSLG